ncbi:hypothetical protein ACWGST_15650 [Agromyces sp. NPDC055520]
MRGTKTSALDADALAEQQAAIQEAVDKVKTVCVEPSAPAGY